MLSVLPNLAIALEEVRCKTNPICVKGMRTLPISTPAEKSRKNGDPSIVEPGKKRASHRTASERYCASQQTRVRDFRIGSGTTDLPHQPRVGLAPHCRRRG